MYLSMAIGVHLQTRRASPRKPQGQGFMAATSMKLAGNVVDVSARAMVTTPPSSGCRSTSRLPRLNSGSSSRNRTP
jgi:hypothetical protein